MRYFTYLADQSFKTSATGERLFIRNGPWSRPFIIPNDDVERKLYKKQTWVLRVMLGGLIVGQPFIFAFYPDILREWKQLLGYILAVTLTFQLIRSFILSADLKHLERAPRRLDLRSFVTQTAERNSLSLLIAAFSLSLTFVGAGVWMFWLGTNEPVTFLSLGAFGLCSVLWGYSIWLKLGQRTLRK